MMTDKTDQLSRDEIKNESNNVRRPHISPVPFFNCSFTAWCKPPDSKNEEEEIVTPKQLQQSQSQLPIPQSNQLSQLPSKESQLPSEQSQLPTYKSQPPDTSHISPDQLPSEKVLGSPSPRAVELPAPSFELLCAPEQHPQFSTSTLTSPIKLPPLSSTRALDNTSDVILRRSSDDREIPDISQDTPKTRQISSEKSRIDRQSDTLSSSERPLGTPAPVGLLLRKTELEERLKRVITISVWREESSLFRFKNF